MQWTVYGPLYIELFITCYANNCVWPAMQWTVYDLFYIELFMTCYANNCVWPVMQCTVYDMFYIELFMTCYANNCVWPVMQWTVYDLFYIELFMTCYANNCVWLAIQLTVALFDVMAFNEDKSSCSSIVAGALDVVRTHDWSITIQRRYPLNMQLEIQTYFINYFLRLSQTK